MDTIIKVIGIVFVALAVFYIILPDVMKRTMHSFRKTPLIYTAATIRLALVVIFLLAARECERPIIIFILAALFVFGGLLILFLGPNRFRSILDWYLKQPPILLRIAALLLLAAGALIIYAA